VRALLHDLAPGTVSCGERVLRIDLATKTAETTNRTIRWKHLVSSAPLPKLLAMTGLPHDEGAWSWNQVVVWNLGFDRKGQSGVHWMYFPDREVSFYRVGWYDNILDGDRMSLYVEIGAPAGARPDPEVLRARVLEDLARERVIDGHALVSSHTVTLDPAYVHITKRSIAEQQRTCALLDAAGVHSVGRYGGWTYCSIEDNLIETQALAVRLA
jgi:protoporphyrinogen oxidase